MVQPYRRQCSMRSARQAISPTLNFTPSHIGAAVQKVLLFGLAFGALPVVTPSVLAQTAHSEVDASDKQSPSPVAGGVATLPAVTVKGEATMPTYPGGQVGTGGRMGFLGEKDFMETPFSTITYTNEFITDQQASDIQGVISRTDPTVFASGIAGESWRAIRFAACRPTWAM